MTRALRTRHRHVVLALAVVLPAALALALRVRPGLPTQPLPEGIAAPPVRAGVAPSWRLAFHEGDLQVVASLAGDGAFELEAQSAVGQPDLLVYWAKGAAEGGSGLPDGSILLGPLPLAGKRRLPLPARPASGGGRLVVYDLAHAKVVAAAAIPEGAQR